jgi:Family of unknown function (DUF6992)
MMWSDTLLRAEYWHLTQLLAWSATSVLVGGTALLLMVVRRAPSPLVNGFATQCVLWGTVTGVGGWVTRNALAARDLAGALRLDRLVWFSSGLDIGLLAVGATLILCGWRLGGRMTLVGAGAGIATQGLALLVLQLGFALRLSGMF